MIYFPGAGYSGSVQDFLFGSIVGVSNEDITNAAIMGAVILLVLWLFHRQIVTVSLDRESARAMGLPVLALDIVLYVLVTISVVLGLQTLGNVLVLALLVIPASAARLACRRLGSMMVFSPVFGGICSVVGLYLSWAFNLPTGRHDCAVDGGGFCAGLGGYGGSFSSARPAQAELGGSGLSLQEAPCLSLKNQREHSV